MIKLLKMFCLCLLFYITAIIPSEAKNMIYQGMEILLDQPKGDLKYYNVHLEITRTYRDEISTKSDEFTVPFVFDNDKVYMKNLIGSYGNWPTWMEGRLVDGDIILDTGVIYAFSLATVEGILTWGHIEYNPLHIFTYARLNPLEGIIEDLDDVKSVTLRKKDSGFITDFGENEGIKGFDSLKYVDIVTKFECYPSEFPPVIPPSGYKIEKYQINFNPYTSFRHNISAKGSASLLLDVVKTEKEIYIQGLSYIESGNCEAWLKGEIVGDKVIFKNGVPFGVGNFGKIMYCTPATVDHQYLEGGMHDRHYIYFTPVENLTMDFDPATGKLSNPSCNLAFTSAPNETLVIYDNTEAGVWYQEDVFADMEMIKIPENITHEPCPMDGLDVNYLDKNGYMMNPDNLYVWIYEDSLPYEAKYIDYNTWTKAYGYVVPFGNTYFENKYKTNLSGLGDRITNFQYVQLENCPDYSKLTGVLYYSEDGEIPNTPPNAGIDELHEDMETTLKDRSVIYDLTGRRYESKANLSPGLYIINGKKVKLK